MKSERLGLMMITSSLCVIALIIGLLFEHQRASRLSQLRIQGVSLTQLLSSMPLEHLVSQHERQGPLHLVRSTQGDPEFAYVVVADPLGAFLAEVTAPGIIVPRSPVGPAPSSWFGERTVSSPGGNQLFREFHAPVLAEGELVAHVRVGYTEPSFALTYRKLPFFALLALPIFLLAVLFYYLIKREINPLKQLSTQIRTILEENPIHSVDLRVPEEIGEFVTHINRVLKTAEARIQTLQTEQTGIVTSSKVLSYQKARIESVLQSLPEAVIVMDEAATVTYASRKLGSMVGIDHAAIINLKPHEWCRMPALLAFLTSYSGHTARRNESNSIEISPQDMPEKRIAVSAYPLFTPRDSSRIYGTLVVFHDVTAESLARRARKEFVAHLSHELKTPLHVIGMYGEMLVGDEEPSKDFIIEAGNIINDEVERVNALIKNMLSIAKIEMGSISLDRQRTKLRDLLKDAFDTVTRSAKEHALEFKLELPNELNPVNIDKDLLRVAINNLLTNAIKYNRPGGQVVLGAEENDDHIRIFVRDTGVGIRPEDQGHIFDKFFRAKDEATKAILGHGLGLSLAREIVTLHHGEIKVWSSPGEGSEFSIVIDKTPVLLREAV